MRSSAPDRQIVARGPGTASPDRLVLATTYAVIVSGALLLAVAEQTARYVVTAGVLCLAHALIVGPAGPAYVGKRAGQLLALGALAFGLLQGQFGSLHVSYGLAHFLVFVQLIKLYGPHGNRDLRLIQVATIFETLVAGIWALDLIYLPMFVLTALSLMAHSAAMAMAPPADGRRVAPSGASERQAGWRNLLAGLWLPAGTVCAFTVLLFVLMPRARLLAAAYRMPVELVTGFSENVSLQEVGMLRTSDDVALRVEFFDEDRPGRPPTRPPRMLLRGLSLPVYGDGQWFGYGRAGRGMFQTAPAELLNKGPDFASYETYVLRNVPVRTRLIRQRITVESRPIRPAFALYRPVRLDDEPPYRLPIDDLVTHHLARPRRVGPGETYEVLSLVPLFSADQLDAADAPEPAGQLSFFWHVPSDIRETLERAAAEVERRYAPRTDYQRVLAVQSYLLNPGRFTYTYDLPDFGDKEPIEAFLAETRRGSCEQFSTAMALLLRVWGIPTRLVIGFKGGEYSPVTEQYIIRDKHAHAWVEAYFTGLGWVEFDPTPGAEIVGEQRTGLLAGVRRLLGEGKSVLMRLSRTAQMHWGGNVVGYNRTQQQQLLRGLADAARQLANQGTSLFRSVWPGMPDLGFGQIGLLVASITFVGMGLYLLAQWVQGRLRLRRPRPGEVRTVGFYQELLSILRRKGLRRPPHVTPREFARAACEQLAGAAEDSLVLAGALELVTDLFYRVRFGGYELTEEQWRQVRQALTVLSRAPRARPRR